MLDDYGWISSQPKYSVETQITTIDQGGERQMLVRAGLNPGGIIDIWSISGHVISLTDLSVDDINRYT